MADESCVYPEGEPPTPGQWLDLETAELLLRGESPEAVDPAARDQADRLAKTLESLTAQPARAGVELPGEEAALAAFRKVRAGRADDWVTPSAAGRPHDAGLVRLGRPGPDAPPRRSRPHFGLAAALAVGMVGVGALVTATGIVPSLTGGDDPSPAASVSAPATPGQPKVSPSPTVPESKPSADGSDEGSRDTARGGTQTNPGAVGGTRGELPTGEWGGAESACRDLRGGKGLSGDRRRSLEDAAGGSTQVWKYCRGVLKDRDTGTGTDDRKARGEEGDQGEDSDRTDRGGQNGQGDGNGQEDGGGNSQGDGQFMAPRKNRHNPDGGVSETPVDPTAAPTSTTAAPTADPTPSPEPTYSAV
ncbi:hypothetical protein ABZ896_11915 [Streptomyces sp. NPDC047072]|uniref:hypothetical protein n=1 Tax=Streptomyces sp. NPDC047072 TaxID=3154809 RepID=UPI0033E02F5C